MTWNGTPADPESPSWEEYQTAVAGLIPEDDWPRFRAEAFATIIDVTLGRSEEATSESDLAAIEQAVFRTADALYAAETGVISESLGSYSYTRPEALTRVDAENVAERALARTGMCYRGLGGRYTRICEQTL